MRVLVVSNLYPPDCIGGYEIACAQTAEALASRGHEVVVLTGSAPPVGTDLNPSSLTVERRLALAQIYDDQLADGAHPLLVLASLELESQWVEPHNVATLLDVLDRHRPDVAFFHNIVGVGGLGLLQALRMRGVPWVWNLGDSVPNWLVSDRGEIVPELAALWPEVTSDGRWIVVSHRLRADVEQAGIRLAGPVIRIPPSVDVAQRPPSIPAPGAGRPLRLAFAGQVAERKGTALAVDAVGLLARRGVDVSLDCWGTVLDEDLPRRVVHHGLDDRVRFHGQVPHAEALDGVAACDLLLFPTWVHEAFGMVAAEAAGLGTPPVITDSGVAEFLEDGQHCLFVERSALALADAVCRVYDGEVDLPSLARQAAAHVRATLVHDVIVPRVEAELLEAAATRRHPRLTSEATYALALVAERLGLDIIEQRFA